MYLPGHVVRVAPGERNSIANRSIAEDAADRRDRARFLPAAAIALPILVIGSIAIGGRAFVLPWILMFALACAAGCAWRGRRTLDDLLFSTVFVPPEYVEMLTCASVWYAIVLATYLAATLFAPEVWKWYAVGFAAISSALGLFGARIWLEKNLPVM